MYKIDEFIRNGEKAEKALVFIMHGYGADMHDLSSLHELFGEGVVSYSLNGPGVLPSPEGTIEGRAWFALSMGLYGIEYDVDDLDLAADAVIEFIIDKTKQEDVSPNQVYLCGFSQGSSLVHKILLSRGDLIKGGMALSSRYVEEIFECGFDSEELKAKKLFLSHGKYDEMIPVDSGHQIRDFYQNNEIDFEYFEFNDGHTIPPKCGQKIKHWFKSL